MVKAGLWIKTIAVIYVIVTLKLKRHSNRLSLPFGLLFLYILYKIHDIGCWKYKLKNKSIPLIGYKPGLGSLQWMMRHAEHQYHTQFTRVTHDAISERKEKIIAMSGLKINYMSNFNYHLYDPRIIEYIFKDTFENYVKGPVIHDPFEEFFGDGIFVVDLPEWKFHRKVAARMFSMRNLKRHMFGCAITNSDTLLKTMEQLSGTQYENELDLYQLFGRFTLQSFVETAFGTKLHIIESYPNENVFCSAFDRLLNLCESRFLDPFWKIKRFFKIGQREGIDIPHDARVLNAFCKQMIDDKKKQQLLTDESGRSKYDLLSLFMKHGRLQKKEISDTFMRDITMNFVIAARDTTRILLSWFFYELTKDENQYILNTIYQEIDAHKQHKLIYGDCAPYFGTLQEHDFVNQNCAGLTPKCHGPRDSRKYKYLEAVICEILRLYPPVTLLQRYANKDDIQIPYETLDGNKRTLYIDKGDGVCIHTPSYLRLPRIWGTNGRDPNKINVANFYENGINTYSAYKFPVFNLQPRMCLGKTMALLQIKVVLISILRKYKISAIKDQEVTSLLSPLYVMKNGFKVKITPRKSV